VGTGEATPLPRPAEATPVSETPPVGQPTEAEPTPAGPGSEFLAPAVIGAETQMSDRPPAPERTPALAPEQTPAPAAEAASAPPTELPAPAPETAAAPPTEAPAPRTEPPAIPTVPPVVPPAAETQPPAAPAVVASAASTAGQEREVAAPPPGVPGDTRQGGGGGGSRRRYLLAALGLLVLAGAVVGVVLASTGGSSTPTGERVVANARPVPTNHVTGGGTATLVLNGDQVTATVNVHGLVNQVHFMHIHAGGLGACPPASAARQHNGHLAISTGNGIKFYGPPQVVLTNSGSTAANPTSIVDSSRYPFGGTINYKRTFNVPPGVAAAIRNDNAVFVVHGISYDNTGFYDSFLGPSDLDSKLPGEATAPALCGALVAMGSASASRPGPQTYAVVLRPPVASSAAQLRAFVLFCHLAGVNRTLASDPSAILPTTT
jgi:hypothetical protein